MIDAAAVTGRYSRDGDIPAAVGTDETISVVPLDADALASYRRLCENAVASPAQCADWIGSWAANTDADFLLAFVESAYKPGFALALEVARSGPFRVGRFVGGSHANGNFPAATREFLQQASGDHMNAIVAAIRKARPDIDLLSLERQVESLGGHRNPLLSLARVESPNVALAVNLEGGFDALLERSSGKRKRKKYRSQIRKFENAGGYRRFQASTKVEVDELLTAFFEMKSRRFAKMGIADVFADRLVRTSLRGLFTSALARPRPPFVLHGLEVGGRLRAVSGSSICTDRVVCDFVAIAEDDLVAASPGDFLFFENIREACEAGFAIYDFSVGDEAYKRHWCDIETRQFDTIIPLTQKGRLVASSKRAASAAKRVLKQNRFLWALAKRLRKNRQAVRPVPDDDA